MTPTTLREKLQEADGAAVCPVCKGHGVYRPHPPAVRGDPCAFCMGLRTVTGDWRHNFKLLKRTGRWLASTRNRDGGLLHRPLVIDDIRVDPYPLDSDVDWYAPFGGTESYYAGED